MNNKINTKNDAWNTMEKVEASGRWAEVSEDKQ